MQRLAVDRSSYDHANTVVKRDADAVKRTQLNTRDGKYPTLSRLLLVIARDNAHNKWSMLLLIRSRLCEGALVDTYFAIFRGSGYLALCTYVCMYVRRSLPRYLVCAFICGAHHVQSAKPLKMCRADDVQQLRFGNNI